MVKQISDNEIYLLIKYVKSVLWRAAKCLSYIEDARCLKVNKLVKVPATRGAKDEVHCSFRLPKKSVRVRKHSQQSVRPESGLTGVMNRLFHFILQHTDQSYHSPHPHCSTCKLDSN